MTAQLSRYLAVLFQYKNITLKTVFNSPNLCLPPIHEKRTNNKGDSSLEEDSDDEVTNYIGKEIVFLPLMVKI